MALQRGHALKMDVLDRRIANASCSVAYGSALNPSMPTTKVGQEWGQGQMPAPAHFLRPQAAAVLPKRQQEGAVSEGEDAAGAELNEEADA